MVHQHSCLCLYFQELLHCAGFGRQVGVEQLLYCQVHQQLRLQSHILEHLSDVTLEGWSVGVEATPDIECMWSSVVGIDIVNDWEEVSLMDIVLIALMLQLPQIVIHQRMLCVYLLPKESFRVLGETLHDVLAY